MSHNVCVCVVRVPAVRIVHEEQVEQSVSGIRKPSEFILQIVVRLLPQTVLTDERQLRETL